MKEYNMIEMGEIFGVRRDTPWRWINVLKIIKGTQRSYMGAWHVSKKELRNFMRRNARMGATKNLIQN